MRRYSETILTERRWVRPPTRRPKLWRQMMLAYTLPQMIFFFMVAGVAAMVFIIVARMLRA
jgi:hypothetical protein